MATRSITGTVLRSDGSPWVGATVRFQLVDDAYTASPAQTLPISPIEVATDAAGQFTVVLISGLDRNYRVALPDRSTFEITVPAGSATTLETLRAATFGTPTPNSSVETALLALYGSPPIGRAAVAVQEGDVTKVAEALFLDFDDSDFNVTESPTGEANISLNYGTGAGQPAEGNHTHAGWTPASSSGPASLALAEDTDNGANKITIVAPASLSADYTQTLPAATGTIALAPTMTLRTNGTSVTNNNQGTVTATCSAGEVITGGGCTLDATASTTVINLLRFDGSNGFLCSLANTSGATRTLTAQAMCAKFGA